MECGPCVEQIAAHPHELGQHHADRERRAMLLVLRLEQTDRTNAAIYTLKRNSTVSVANGSLLYPDPIARRSLAR
jgi:hypothetical protein